ncbi:MAG: ATP-dependent helicase RecG [Pseudomonadota bacterium]|jgi:ATP-dependent DNA helicase RecG
MGKDWPEGFNRLGLRRSVDLLLHFPSRYEDESRVWPLARVGSGDSVQCQVRVLSARVQFKPRRTLLVEVEDDSGTARLRFFYFHSSYGSQFAEGREIRVLGEARRLGAVLEFVHPSVRVGWLTPESLADQPLVPIYPTTQGLAQTVIRRHIQRVLQTTDLREWLPDAVLQRAGVLPLLPALERIHMPSLSRHGAEAVQQVLHQRGPAWDRIRLDELLAQQLALRHARERRTVRAARALRDERGLVLQLTASLPFSLTEGQSAAWREVSQDLAAQRPAHRLIQGDVGSGKTVIAALSVAQAVGSGCQAAVMAPTELLAQQLFQKLTAWLSPLGVRVEALMGGQSASVRRDLLQRLGSGEAQVVVGTHALIQKGVRFQCLGLALVDEQHRFGVAQRVALREGQEGLSPHIVGMSATPIPRSLAMTFLADLDVSVIADRPPGRQPIRTRLLSQSRREELLERLLRFTAEQGRAYWVCPVIEEQEESEKTLTALEETVAWLRPHFQERMAVVHGRLSAAEKSAAMSAFASGQCTLLVATTVIEVGVDVPQARLMVIDHAERFGLAQLHQLRGRVGRGEGQSTCVLLFEEPLSALARERLKALYECEDGFELSRRDLALRGPGELLGTRQSGEPALRYSDLTQDEAVVQFAVEFGAELMQEGLAPQVLSSLLDRWAYRTEDYLTSV